VSESAVGELDGRRVLVTGAATGIGAAAVEAFTSHGATVAAPYTRRHDAARPTTAVGDPIPRLNR
jgi:NAD(P)-dependent dehydrogenase (short-subunit alcohol dehydrogenase family)